jgi:hypothetical protein
MYLPDLLKTLFGHAYVADPTVFWPNQHVEHKKSKGRMCGKSTAYISNQYRLITKHIFYLPCRCRRNFAHDRSEKLAILDPCTSESVIGHRFPLCWRCNVFRPLKKIQPRALGWLGNTCGSIHLFRGSVTSLWYWSASVHGLVVIIRYRLSRNSKNSISGSGGKYPHTKPQRV